MLRGVRNLVIVQVDNEMETGHKVIIAGAARRRGVVPCDCSAIGLDLHPDVRLALRQLPHLQGLKVLLVKFADGRSYL